MIICPDMIADSRFWLGCFIGAGLELVLLTTGAFLIIWWLNRPPPTYCAPEEALNAK